MKRRNFAISVSKLMAGVLVAGAVVSVPVTNVYAYTPSSSTTNQLGVKCDTIEVKTICEAKALVEELKKDGIKANLTLNCYNADIENYLKSNLANVPIATLYECIKFVQKNTNNPQATTYPMPTNNPNANNQNSTCPNATNKPNENNQNSTCPNATNKPNENNQNSTCQKETNKTENVATVEPTNKANSATSTTQGTDTSPKTGDSTSILMMGGIMMLSMFGMISLYFRKRKNA